MDINTLLTKNKSTFLNVAVIIFALIVANNLYKNTSAQLSKLKEQEKNEGMKTEVIRNLSRLEARLNQFKANLGKRDSNFIINDMNTLSKETGIKIRSIKPDTEIKTNDYVKTPLSLALKASNYHVVGKFISKLESSSEVFYVIDSLRILPASEGEGLDVNMKLTSVSVAN